MKTKHVFRILSVLLLVAMTFFAASPAYADTHYQIVIPVDDYWAWPEGYDLNPCDFDIEFHYYGNFRANYWLDETGQVTREFQISGNLKLEISAYGKKLNILIQGPVKYTTTENKVTALVTGTNGVVTVPGYGKVDGWAGQRIETYSIDPDTGEWILISVEKWVGSIEPVYNPGPICEYLGPG